MVANNAFAAVLALFVALVTSMFYLLQSELVNARLPAESRATLLSFKGQAGSICIMVVFPLIWLLAERTSLQLALLCFIICALPVTLYLISKINHIGLGRPGS